MKNLRIFSNKNFLLEIENSNYFLEPTNYVEVSNCEKNNLLLKIYPVDQSNLSIPFCINIESEKSNIKTQNECVKVYNFNNRAEIFISPFLISSNIVVYTASHTVKNTKYTISCYENRIKIFSSKGEYVYETDITNASSFVVNNNINILCNNDKGKTLVVFNVLNNVFSQVGGDKIEIDGDTIKTQQNINDMAQHICVCSFVQNDDLTLKEKEIYTKTPQIKSTKNSLLVPYNFFEAIKVEDFKLAKTYLSTQLQNNLTNEQLSSYFGHFDNIGILSLSPLCYTLYSNQDAKDYEISLRNDKIVEINQI